MDRKKEKRFLSYTEQADYLNGKGVSCYGKDEQVMLRRLGYFNLVSGYKWPFVSSMDKDGSYLYVKGTSVEQMVKVKNFDDDLRMLLLRYITKAEDEIRAIVAYKIDDVNFEEFGEAISWNETRAFDYTRSSKEIKRLVYKMERELSFNRVSYLKEYRRKYEKVPTWLLFKFISFVTFIDALECAKGKVKDDVCRLYGVSDRDNIVNHDLLIAFLHWLRKVRNVCAHNERVYDVTDKNRLFERYVELLPVQRESDKEVKRIFDCLIYLKYFLDSNDYAGLIGQIRAMLKRLEAEILGEAFCAIMKDLGIANIGELDFLLGEKKAADYLGI